MSERAQIRHIKKNHYEIWLKDKLVFSGCKRDVKQYIFKKNLKIRSIYKNRK